MNVIAVIKQRARRWRKNVRLKGRQEMLQTFLIAKFKDNLTFGKIMPKYWSVICNFSWRNWVGCRSQWPRYLRRGSAAAHLLGLRVRIPPGTWMFVCCECCVLSGRCLCDGLITRPVESSQVWRVWVWSWILGNEEALTNWGLLRHGKKYWVKWQKSRIW